MSWTICSPISKSPFRIRCNRLWDSFFNPWFLMWAYFNYRELIQLDKAYIKSYTKINLNIYWNFFHKILTHTWEDPEAEKSYGFRSSFKLLSPRYIDARLYDDEYSIPSSPFSSFLAFTSFLMATNLFFLSYGAYIV